MTQSPVRCRILTTPRADDLDSFLIREAEDDYFAKYGADLNRPTEFRERGWIGRLVDKFLDRLRDYCS